MAIRFFVDFEGPLTELDQAQRRINQGVLRPAFERMRDDYQAIMRQTYARQRTPGYRWPPNNPHYVRYDKLKRGNPPGVRTGAIRNAHTTGRGLGAVNVIRNNEMQLGTNLRYGNFSAAGPRRPRRGVVVDQFTQTFARVREGDRFVRRVRDRRIPVRDPLLALYTPATRAIRRSIRQRWEGYILDELSDAITDSTTIRLRRPRRQSRRPRRA